MNINIEIKRVKRGGSNSHNEELPLPTFATDGSAAIDLRVDLSGSPMSVEVIPPGAMRTIGTGIAIHIGSASDGKNYVGIVAPRSSTGRAGFTLSNTTGIIDKDYQGEILLSVYNRGDDYLRLSHGERVTQMLFLEVARPTLVEVDEFSNDTKRGSGGFGSTGKFE
jgi:dUTP pyrophosphatase